MTDREMLELAARAGGYARHEYVENSARDGRVVTGHYDSLLEVCINPLDDDGDALRLAVRLNIPVIPYDDETSTGTVGVVANNWGSKEANTRRAITRAAAEVGRQMGAPK